MPLHVLYTEVLHVKTSCVYMYYIATLVASHNNTVNDKNCGFHKMWWSIATCKYVNIKCLHLILHWYTTHWSVTHGNCKIITVHTYTLKVHKFPKYFCLHLVHLINTWLYHKVDIFFTLGWYHWCHKWAQGWLAIWREHRNWTVRVQNITLIRYVATVQLIMFNFHYRKGWFPSHYVLRVSPTPESQ